MGVEVYIGRLHNQQKTMLSKYLAMEGWSGERAKPSKKA